MVLTVNIGNTHISVGGYHGREKLFSGRLSARPLLTADECAIALGQLLELHGHGGCRWEGAILGSVAPPLTAPMTAALRRRSEGRVLTVGPGLKSGLAICIDDPGQLGAELLCAGVAALDLAPVAGFLEVGETLEECVRREVREETGLEIENIQYFDSQPWPYPSGIMIGFFADYKSGEIRLQDDELSAGRFFTIDNLPELPQKLSIARRMIERWRGMRIEGVEESMS